MGPFKLRLFNGSRAVAPLTNLWALGQPLGPLDPVIPGLPLLTANGDATVTPAPDALVLAGYAPTITGADPKVAFISDEVVTSSADSGSASITVPADCDCAVIIACGWTGGARVLMPMTTASINSVNSTSAQSSNDNAFEKIDLRYLVNPATGAQTFAWDFGDTGAITEGAIFIIAYFKNVDDAAPIVNSGKSSTTTTITLTGGGAGDMMVGGSSSFDTAATVTGNSQTSLSTPARFNNAFARGAYKAEGGSYVISGGDAQLCNAAVLLKAVAPSGGVENYSGTPALDALILTGQAPTTSASAAALPAAQALTLTGLAPTISVSVNAAPALAALVLTGPAPSIAASSATAPGAAAMALTGLAPSVSAVDVVEAAPPAGSLNLTGQAPSITASADIAPADGALVLTGPAPAVSASANPAPALAALTLSGQAPTVAVSLNAQPAAAALTLSGQAPTLAFGAAVLPSALALTLTGSSPEHCGWRGLRPSARRPCLHRARACDQRKQRSRAGCGVSLHHGPCTDRQHERGK